MIDIFSKRKHKSSSAESLTDSNLRRPLSAMDLPLDIWFLVIDNLSIRTKVHLSHTCRDLRALVTRRLPEEVRSLSPSVSHFQFTAAWASETLEAFACVDCSGGHGVIPRDLPTAPWLYRPRYCGRVPWAGTYATDFINSEYYQLRHRHVQLALKYTSRPSRLRKDHKQLLADLMAPFTYTRTRWIDNTGSRSIDRVRTELQYQAQPKIVDIGETARGNKLRFVVREEWRYTPLDELGSHARLRWTWDYVAREALWYLSTCIHQDLDLNINRHDMTRPSSDKYSFSHTISPMLGHIEQLLDKPVGHTTSFSCGVCPTDFELRIEEDSQGVHSFVVRVWKDVGITENEWRTRVDFDPQLFRPRAIPRQPTQDMAGEPRYMYENGRCCPGSSLCFPERQAERQTSRWRRWLQAVRSAL